MEYRQVTLFALRFAQGFAEASLTKGCRNHPRTKKTEEIRGTKIKDIFFKGKNSKRTW